MQSAARRAAQGRSPSIVTKQICVFPMVAEKVGRIANPSEKYRCETEKVDGRQIARTVMSTHRAANRVSVRLGRIGNPSYQEVYATLGYSIEESTYNIHSTPLQALDCRRQGGESQQAIKDSD